MSSSEVSIVLCAIRKTHSENSEVKRISAQYWWLHLPDKIYLRLGYESFIYINVKKNTNIK